MKPAVFTEFYLIHCLIHTHTHNIPHLYDNHTHQKFSCVPESISVASGPQLCKLRKYFDRQKSWLQQLCTRIDEMISRLQIDIFLNKKQPDNKCSRELEVLIKNDHFNIFLKIILLSEIFVPNIELKRLE